MNWIAATLLSACLLGCYDLATKHAVEGNAVLPVLFLSNACSAGIWISLMVLAALHPGLLPGGFAVAPLAAAGHARLLLKSAIVAGSWSCTYFAVKHLPVSIASPIRATGPVWTLFGALALLGERPNLLEDLGLVITLAAFVALSVAGRAEGIRFLRNPWIGWLLLGALLNAASALYDRYLFARQGFSAATVQAWFSIYLAALFLPLAVGWRLRWWTRHPFRWRWSIPLLSVFLLSADLLYFHALRDPAGLISLVSSLRRLSTVVAFAGGILLFRERNGRGKLPAVGGVLAGIGLTLLGQQRERQ